MANIDHAVQEWKEMDDLAALDSPVHALHPLVKLIITVSYILITVSFGKYELSAMAVMVLYPAVMFAMSGIPVGTCFHKLRIVLPLVCAVGLFNPFFDTTPVMMIGGCTVTGGVISMITLMLKGVFCLTASFLFAATTPADRVCAALRQLHLPAMIVTLFLLTYRYVSLMMEELSVMMTAYRLRAPGQKGVHWKAWGSFLGQLILRSMDRAEELYASMQLRGFDGSFRYADGQKLTVKDGIIAVLTVGLFVLARCFDVAQLVGNRMM